MLYGGDKSGDQKRLGKATHVDGFDRWSSVMTIENQV